MHIEDCYTFYKNGILNLSKRTKQWTTLIQNDRAIHRKKIYENFS